MHNIEWHGNEKLVTFLRQTHGLLTASGKERILFGWFSDCQPEAALTCPELSSKGH